MLHIFTINWNGAEKLKALIPTLKRNLENIQIESKWHIRDNGSTDESIKIITESGATLYSIGHNKDNYAVCHNYLFNQAHVQENDIILLLNNDVVFADDFALSKMLNLLTSGVGVVGCRLLYVGTNKLQHGGVIFGERYGRMPYHFRHQEESDKYAEMDREFQAVTAACCLVRAKDWIDVGGFCEEYFWAFDDIDFCLKINKDLNKKIMYCGNVKVYHEESASLKKNPVNKLFMPASVRIFKERWVGKYDLDHEKYLKDKRYLVK